MMTASKLCSLITNLRWNDSAFKECTVESAYHSREKSILACLVKESKDIQRFWLRVKDPNVFALHLSFNYEKSSLKSIDVVAFMGTDTPSDFAHIKTITKGKDQVLKTLFEKIKSEALKSKKRESAQRNKSTKFAIKSVANLVSTI